MSSIILANRRDEQNIIEEEKKAFVYDVLTALGADSDILNSVAPNEIPEYLTLLELEVWNNADGTIDILRKGKLVGQWKVPKLILIRNGKESYYEIHLNEWALPFQMKKRGE